MLLDHILKMLKNDNFTFFLRGGYFNLKTALVKHKNQAPQKCHLLLFIHNLTCLKSFALNGKKTRSKDESTRDHKILICMFHLNKSLDQEEKCHGIQRPGVQLFCFF